MAQESEDQTTERRVGRGVKIALGVAEVSLIGAGMFVAAGVNAFIPGAFGTGFFEYIFRSLPEPLRSGATGAAVTNFTIATIGGIAGRSPAQTLEAAANLSLEPFRWGRSLYHNYGFQQSLRKGNRAGYEELVEEGRKLARSNVLRSLGVRSSATRRMVGSWASHYRHKSPTFQELQRNTLIRQEAARSVRNKLLTPEEGIVGGYQDQFELAVRRSQVAANEAVRLHRDIASGRRKLRALAEKREYHSQRVRNAAVALEAADIAVGTAKGAAPQNQAQQHRLAAEQRFKEVNNDLAQAEKAYKEKEVEIYGKAEEKNEKGEVTTPRVPGLLDQEEKARKDALEAIVAAKDARESRGIALKSYLRPLLSVRQPPGRKGIAKWFGGLPLS
jgi:hypothetical protein